MLVKWALEGRRKTAKTKPSRNVNDHHKTVTASAPTSVARNSVKDHPRASNPPGESETTAQALTAQLDRLHYQSDAAFARTTEDEGDRAMRRIQAEERDTKLRDEKLLSLVGPQLVRHNSSQRVEARALMPLTEENIEKLAHEQDGSAGVQRQSTSPDADSNLPDQFHSRSISRLARPALSGTQQRESEKTIVERIDMR